MTNVDDFIVEITEPWDPLKCFKKVAESEKERFSPLFALDMMTHTNNPKIMEMMATRMRDAMDKGVVDYDDCEPVVLGMVAGREARDDVRDIVWQIAAEHEAVKDFDYVEQIPKFIDKESHRSNMYNAWHLREVADLSKMDFVGYTDIGAAPECEVLDLSLAKNIPEKAFDFSRWKNLYSLSLGMADCKRAKEVKIPESVEELDLRKNHHLMPDLSALKNLKTLHLGEEDIKHDQIVLPPNLEELNCGYASGLAMIGGQLGDCEKLKRVSFVSCDLSACPLAKLPPNIEELDLSFAQNISRGLRDFSAYKHLKRVTFNGVDFKPEDLKLPEGCVASVNGQEIGGKKPQKSKPKPKLKEFIVRRYFEGRNRA